MSDSSNTVSETVDLLVIGAGAAGMTAALVGAVEGLHVLLCEKTDQVWWMNPFFVSLRFTRYR